MKLQRAGAAVFCGGGADPEVALARTTHLGIGAHPDDLEILAIHGILECFQRSDRAFSGIVLTDGAGSSREFDYQDYTDERMRAVRRSEQKKAARVGEYSAQVMLDYPSEEVKSPSNRAVVDDLVQILQVARPEVVYTHNPCDKHDTHVAVALRSICALRELPPECRPARVIGCEVWRDLDWLPDDLKVTMDVSPHQNLQAALLGVFDSQIAGGKRYDLAAMGRRRAHATFGDSHAVDGSSGVVYGMDLTRLLTEPELDPAEFVVELVGRFSEDVRSKVLQFAGS